MNHFILSTIASPGEARAEKEREWKNESVGECNRTRHWKFRENSEQNQTPEQRCENETVSMQ